MRFILIISGASLLMYSCSPKQATQDPAAIVDSQKIVSDSMVDTPASASNSVDTMDVNSNLSAPGEWDPGKVSYSGEQAIIYKTKKDYSRNVPVRMNADKTKVISYPAPKDLFYKDKLAYPFQLTEGYLLDNRGVHEHSVFLNMTYDEYSKLDQAPKLEDMMSKILDKEPFLEIYSLGERGRFKDEVKEINEIIERKALKKFRRIK